MMTNKQTLHITLLLTAGFFLYMGCKKENPPPALQGPRETPADAGSPPVPFNNCFDYNTPGKYSNIPALPGWNMRTMTEPSGNWYASGVIYFLNKDIGFLSNSFGHLHKTTDGGQTWKDLGITAGGDMTIQKISFSDAQHGTLALVNQQEKAFFFQHH